MWVSKTGTSHGPSGWVVTQTFENSLKEPFEKRGLKNELDLIPQRLMKI